MKVSNCCAHPVEVYGAVTKHYRCKKCGEPCDVEEELYGEISDIKVDGVPWEETEKEIKNETKEGKEEKRKIIQKILYKKIN
ncbi:MAG: hypothetical protein ACOCQ4_01700 [bacterium]